MMNLILACLKNSSISSLCWGSYWLCWLVQTFMYLVSMLPTWGMVLCRACGYRTLDHFIFTYTTHTTKGQPARICGQEWENKIARITQGRNLHLKKIHVNHKFVMELYSQHIIGKYVSCEFSRCNFFNISKLQAKNINILNTLYTLLLCWF